MRVDTGCVMEASRVIAASRVMGACRVMAARGEMGARSVSKGQLTLASAAGFTTIARGHLPR